MKKEALFNKVLGSLVGFAIGDAMGATTEFMTPRSIQEKFVQVNTLMGGGWLNLDVGEVTDDTQMMIAVASAYNLALDSAGGEHPVPFEELCVMKFSEWYMTKPKDIGNACRTVIASCFGKSCDAWMEFSKELNDKYPSRGNGSLMRCLYPAIIGDEEAAVAQGLLTHYNEEVSTYIKAYSNILQIYLNSTQTKHRSSKIKCDPEGTAEATFFNAVYWSIQNDFKSAIIGAVNDGGDADTIAALTGGLAGARFGFNSIPVEWIHKLDDDVYKVLTSLAQRATSIIVSKEITL